MDLKKLKEIREAYNKNISEKEDENKHKLEMSSLKSKLDKMVKKHRNPEKCERKVRSQSWFEVMCPRCEMSNRRWLEEGKDPYLAPIKKYDNVCHTRIKGILTDIPYGCRICKNSFSGEEKW